MAEDYYNVLGVEKSASDQDIKRAYRKLAQKYHPDKHKGDKGVETKFKAINEAYETLSDNQKRGQYDQFGSSGANFGQGFQGSNAGFGGMGFDFSGGASGFSDIFESFFNNGDGRARRKRSGAMRGNDIETTIELRFKESVFGTEKELQITKPDVCDRCSGKTVEPGSKMVSCVTCSGAGVVQHVKQTILGQIATSRTCDTCHGEGQSPEKVCTQCHGTGRVRKTENIKVKIPAGVDEGAIIRLSGKGEGGVKGGSHGDLYVHIRVKRDAKFVRDSFDIHTEVKIHVVQAVMGVEIDVETIHGKETLKVPAGTESGKIFRLKNRGVQHVNSSHVGDHFVKVIAEIPKKLSKKAKELYGQLAEDGKLDINPDKGWFS